MSTQITHDRLERAAYHPAFAWVAIEQTPWLIPMPARDEPTPGQMMAHPAYGWLACVRVASRARAGNGVAAGGLIALAPRRALPEEVLSRAVARLWEQGVRGTQGAVRTSGAIVGQPCCSRSWRQGRIRIHWW